MGDRANIILHGSDGTDVVLYTHWHGYEIEALCAAGLGAAIEAGRITDEQYAARMIAETFFEVHTNNGETQTGAGLTGRVWDGEDHVVEVDLAHDQVWSQEVPPMTVARWVESFGAKVSG